MKNDKTIHSNLFKCSNTSMTSRISQFSKHEKKVESKLPINLKKRDINSLMNIMGMLDNNDNTVTVKREKEKSLDTYKENIKNLNKMSLKDYSVNLNFIKKGNILNNINKTYNLYSSKSNSKNSKNAEKEMKSLTKTFHIDNKLINNLHSVNNINNNLTSSMSFRPSSEHKDKPKQNGALIIKNNIKNNKSNKNPYNSNSNTKLHNISKTSETSQEKENITHISQGLGSKIIPHQLNQIHLHQIQKKHLKQTKSVDIQNNINNHHLAINEKSRQNGNNFNNFNPHHMNNVNNVNNTSNINSMMNVMNQKSNSSTCNNSSSKTKAKNLIDKTTGENTMSANTLTNKNKSEFHTLKSLKIKDKNEHSNIDKTDKIEITGPEDLHFSNVLNMQNNKLICKQFENNKNYDGNIIDIDEDEWIS